MKIKKIEKKEKPIKIATWQSIYKLRKAWFEQFDVVIGDEAHLFKAKSLTSILTKMEDCKYRYGFTGTLDGTKTHRLVLEGLFGPVNKVISTKELMDQGHVADLKIKAIVLSYQDAVKKENIKNTYQEEMNFLSTYEPRNNFLKNLSLSLEGNTLLLFQYVEKHGKTLYNMIKENAGDRHVFFVHGGVDGKDRDEIRHIVEQEKDGKELSFGERNIFVYNNEEVPLTNGKMKMGKDITIDDDIDEDWLKNKFI